MIHDVCADPLPPDLRRWVDRAAQDVIAYMNGAPHREPDLLENREGRGCIGPDGMTPLIRAVLPLLRRGFTLEEVADELDCTPSYVGLLRRRFEAEGRL